MNRDYAYLRDHRASVGMNTEDLGNGQQRLTFSLAFCNYRDNFNKKIARKILDGRLDHRLSGPETRLTFETLYEGDTPRNDVFFPVVDTIRNNLGDGDLAFDREHSDIVRTIHAIAANVASTRTLVTL